MITSMDYSPKQNNNELDKVEVLPNGYLTRGAKPIGKLEVGGGINTLLYEREKGILDLPSLVVRGGQKFNRTEVTDAVYTLISTDFLVAVTSLVLAPSIGLPLPSRVGVGKHFIIKDEVGGATSTTITIRSDGEKTIDGASSTTLSTNYESKKFYTDGSNWFTCGESNDLRLDAIPDSDHSANGPTTNSFVANAEITAFGFLLYLNSSSKWAYADADAEATASGLLAMSLNNAVIAADATLLVALPGSFIRDDSWNWTPGAILYVSTNATDITATAPVGSSDVVRKVGYAVTADVIYFNPSAEYTIVP